MYEWSCVVSLKTMLLDFKTPSAVGLPTPRGVIGVPYSIQGPMLDRDAIGFKPPVHISMNWAVIAGYKMLKYFTISYGVKYCVSLLAFNVCFHVFAVSQ